MNRILFIWTNDLSTVYAGIQSWDKSSRKWLTGYVTKKHDSYWACRREAETLDSWKDEAHQLHKCHGAKTLSEIIMANPDAPIEGDGFVPLEATAMGQLVQERPELLDRRAIVDAEGWLLVVVENKGSAWVQPICKLI